MIDCFFRWSSVADAKADALWAINKYYDGNRDAFDASRCLLNVKAWRVSQDSSGVHNYLTGYFAIVALDNVPNAILNSTALAFALQREWRPASTSTSTDAPPAIPVVVKNNIGAVITDIGVSPIFAGSHYPIGGYST